MAREDETWLYLLFGAVLLTVAAAAVLSDGVDAIAGVWRLQVHPARLLNDFVAIEGAGSALLNAVLVAAIGLVIVRATGIRLSGPTIAAVFTMFGFGLFGKTPLNAIPILLGVGIAARLAGKRYRDYILVALFGTALGPMVTALAVEFALPVAWAISAALVAGVAIGVVLPAVAFGMLRLHQGYNLYNVGLTCGLIGIFLAATLIGIDSPLDPSRFWSVEGSLLQTLLVPAVCLLFAGVALITGRRAAFSELARIMKRSGRLPSDFMTMEGRSGTLLNMAAIGMLTWGYVFAVGGPFNGPVLGGIFTAIGFAAFGKHLKNAIPVMAGAVLATLAYGKGLALPGPLLAALFVLTLAPISGEFGWVVGIIAGALHLTLVEQTGAWHLGLNLYNNGFAGGLTATLLVAIIEWVQNARESRQALTKEHRQ